MDYGFAPVTDGVTGLLNEMVARRVAPTTMRTAATVREFIKGLNDDLGIHPVGDLVVGAHANSEGQLFILLYPSQVDIAGRPTSRTEFENLEQTLEASAAGLLRRIRIDDHTIGFTTPPPTHFLHFKGCNLGKALPFVTKLKDALGGHVTVTAPKHFQGVVRVTRKGNNGSFDYMCYEFQVQTPAVALPKGGFRGFAKRADLIDAFDAAGHQYLGGVDVPKADWEKKWVPKDVTKTQTFYMAMPLGATVAGFKELTLRPDKKTGKGGARQFRVSQIAAKWQFVPPAGATTYAARVAALKTAIGQDPRFNANHVWPMYQRSGFATLDAFMDGHLWSFGEKNAGPLATGLRYEYTVVLPITDNSGPKPKLYFNFFPAPGAAQAAITAGIGQSDLDFYAQV
jgi:hypothetical protein